MMNEHSEVLEIKVEPSSDEELQIQKRRGLIHQMTMSIFANISILGPAMGFGYSAVILPTLKSGRSDLTIDEDQGSWIASAAAFGTPIGCILCSFIMRRGRRLSLLVTSTFSLIGWLLIYMSTDYEKLIVGRVIGGIATGLASVPATVYTAEIADSEWRSTLVTWSSMAIAVGILLVYIFGYFVQENWRLIALLCGLFPAVAIIVTILAVPESPMWLRDRGRLDEARVVMKKFRGVAKEHPITAEVEAELRHTRHYQSTKKQSLLKNLTKRSSLYPFIIMLAYFFFQQFSGIFVIVYYAVDITSEAGMKMDKFIGAILIGMTRLIGTLLVGYVSKIWGKRKPSIASGAGITIFMGILSIYLYLQEKGYEINDHGFIPAVCIIMYIFMSTIGFLSLPFAMIGEIFPAKVKDVLSGLTTCAAYIFSFITVKTYPSMLHTMGKHGVFFFYTIISFLGTIFVLMFLPETKGKTLHDIDVLFSKKRRQVVEVQIMEKEKIMPMRDMTAA
ncbi:facilitated trehalose transporter Tret1-2 homolog [Fopius arisanus]|uniref:Facilitated trehalose transporter Tret1-2 homolog n=2 Tax=Fopius arisanus TaxID=64838 RepID=A0A9R1SUQ3_9HYME|nr:PREDICTED: facilitated trehalose transporter Tret1-2 homolog [Fopius arisanus]